jgi:hypothetical protein
MSQAEQDRITVEALNYVLDVFKYSTAKDVKMYRKTWLGVFEKALENKRKELGGKTVILIMRSDEPDKVQRRYEVDA